MRCRVPEHLLAQVDGEHVVVLLGEQRGVATGAASHVDGGATTREPAGAQTLTDGVGTEREQLGEDVGAGVERLRYGAVTQWRHGL